MLEQQSVLKRNKGSTNSTLYRFVFDSYITKIGVAMLFAFMLLQPCSQAYAAFDATADAVQLEQIEIPVVAIPVIESAVDAEVAVPQLANTTSESEEILTTAIQRDDVLPSTKTGLETRAATKTVDFVETTNQTQQEVVPTSTTAAFEEVTVPLAESTSTAETIQTDTATSTLTFVTSVLESQNATQTKEIITPVTQPVVVPLASTSESVVSATDFHNSSEFQFNTSQCAVVGNGAYYCNERKATSSMLSDGVFSAPDSDGDLEIFIRLEGKETQITHNTYDDASPQYDAHTNRIVWHSYINDRYQIVSYDLASQKMIRITDTSYNNMEPVAYGTTTVWQAWVDNNWEIMLYNGITLTQLTKNNVEDVSPHIRDGYVVWQTQFVDGWQVAVYNLETKRIEYIPSEGGLKVENPRFVLVYDSTDKNGDVQTKGYDFDSKTSFDLGSIPAELPDKLPNPDQTGETRALIQNKQTSKEGELEAAIVPMGGTASTTPNNVTPHTLDLSQGTTTVSVQNMATTSAILISDILIPSYTASTTLSQGTSTIFDLVIPPAVSTTTQEVR